MTSAADEVGLRLWQDDYCPFDAIGVPRRHMLPDAPSPLDFVKIVNFARFVLRPARASAAAAAATAPATSGDVAPSLPYTRDEVEQAVKYFTQDDSTGNEELDPVAWEWAFDDIILRKSEGKYARTWAPERVRPRAVLAGLPEIYDLQPRRLTASEAVIKDNGSLSREKPPLVRPGPSSQPQAPSQTQRTTFATQPGPAPASLKALSTEQMRHLKESPKGPPKQQKPNPRNPDWLLLTQKAHHSPSQEPISPSPYSISPETTRYLEELRRDPNRRFIGFHKVQVRMAGPHIYHGLDYRQSVQCVVNPSGRVQYRIRSFNMAGEEVPLKFRLGCSAIARGDVLFRENWHLHECPVWIPTPAAQAKSPATGKQARPIKGPNKYQKAKLRKPIRRIPDASGDEEDGTDSDVQSISEDDAMDAGGFNTV